MEHWRSEKQCDLACKSYKKDIIVVEYSQLKKEVNNIAFNHSRG